MKKSIADAGEVAKAKGIHFFHLPGDDPKVILLLIVDDKFSIAVKHQSTCREHRNLAQYVGIGKLLIILIDNLKVEEARNKMVTTIIIVY